MTKTKRRKPLRKVDRQQSEEKASRPPDGVPMNGVIYDNIFYPKSFAFAAIGVGNSQGYVHIADGHLPPLVAPCAGSSKRGYFGWQIKAIQAAALAAKA